MRIPMPIDADQVTSLTGNEKYGRQLSGVYNDLIKNAAQSCYYMFCSLYSLDLSSINYQVYDNELFDRIREVAIEQMRIGKIVNVWFYPLKGELEIEMVYGDSIIKLTRKSLLSGKNHPFGP